MAIECALITSLQQHHLSIYKGIHPVANIEDAGTYFMPHLSAFTHNLLLVFCLAASLAACGLPERANPADPRIGGDEGDGLVLLAEFPEAFLSEVVDQIGEVRYVLSARDIEPVEGTMDIIGVTARARIRKLTPGEQRALSVLVVDRGGVPTFAFSDTLDIGEKAEEVTVELERLLGGLEVISNLPREVTELQVHIDAGADTLLRTFPSDGTMTQRIEGIPTGADVSISLLGIDKDQQVLVLNDLRADIREGLIARISMEIFGGSVQVIAYFPTYLPIVEVDRFSDSMGTFFRRSDNPDLPAPNEPIEFDDPRFLTRGYGPNGEEMSFYNLDVRPKSPGIVYELIDRRGNPILGQLPIYDRLPGDADYSDFWHIHNVYIQDREYRANSYDSAEDVLGAGLEIEPSETVANHVMVPLGSSANLRYDSNTPRRVQDGWYRGQIVKYLVFENPQSEATVDFGSGQVNTPQMYAFLDNNRDERDGFALDLEGVTTHNVVTRLPGEEGYSPLWVLQTFRIDVFERVFDLASALDMAKNEDNLIDLGRLVYVNAPIVKVGQ